ncbi:MAG: (Na+)-NQR maturation NqrM [Pseudomonadota bacterium]
MATFFFAFGFLMLVVLGMAVGAIFMGRTIKGSCGGLNGVAGADRCLICHKEVDPNSPLRERMECPRARRSAA